MSSSPQKKPKKPKKQAKTRLEKLQAHVRVLQHVQRLLPKRVVVAGRVIRISDVHLVELARELETSGVLEGIIRATSQLINTYTKRNQPWDSVGIGTAADWARGMQKLAKKPQAPEELRREIARKKLIDGR